MSLADRQQALRLELRYARSELDGLSPKCSVYAKVQEKIRNIIKELEQIGAKRTK